VYSRLLVVLCTTLLLSACAQLDHAYQTVDETTLIGGAREETTLWTKQTVVYAKVKVAYTYGVVSMWDSLAIANTAPVEYIRYCELETQRVLKGHSSQKTYKFKQSVPADKNRNEPQTGLFMLDDGDQVYLAYDDVSTPLISMIQKASGTAEGD
jgi:hypothetical protein